MEGKAADWNGGDWNPSCSSFSPFPIVVKISTREKPFNFSAQSCQLTRFPGVTQGRLLAVRQVWSAPRQRLWTYAAAPS